MKIVSIVINSDEPRKLADWYVDAFDGEVERDHEGFFVFVNAAGAHLGFQKPDELSPTQGRIHIDFHTEEDLAEVRKRLVDKGATHLGDHEMPGIKWIMMADPEGNIFDVGWTG